MGSNTNVSIEKYSGTQTIVRAAHILKCFTEENPEWIFSELSKELNINQSTLSRFINTMESVGWLERHPESNKLRIGLEIAALAFSSLNQCELRRIGSPLLDELSQKTKLSATLAVLHTNEAIYIARVEEQDYLFPGNYVLGRVAPLHCSSVGKVLLAFTPQQRQEEILQSLQFKQYTEKTILTMADLKQEINDCINNGYALDLGEWLPQIGSIAAPVWNKAGSIEGAIAISGSLEKIDSSDQKHLIDELVLSAKKLSYSIGDVNSFA